MKKAAIILTILLAAAGIVWMQTAPPEVDLATLMPSGALLYVHANDFNNVLREWNESKVKQNWLASDNYAVFQQSNLFTKLGGAYGEYASAIGFAPVLNDIGAIAGHESALALYDIHDVQFVYVSRVEEAELDKARLWTMRSKFERREVAGIPFWLRADPASGRTVGFTYANGFLFVATRDDLAARSLALAAGGSEPSLASERWYRDATTAAAKKPGELRIVMNLDALVKTGYFRSYWVQRNVSTVRQYWSGIADVSRGAHDIAETRVFLRTADNPGTGSLPADRAAVDRLVALAPRDAGLYRAWASPDARQSVALIVEKMIAPPVATRNESRYAPPSADLSQAAGGEADLETRIDEPPLPSEATIDESVAPFRELVEKTGLRAAMQVESTAPAGHTFIRMPCAIVLASSSPWDEPAVEEALTRVVEPLWTTTGLGAGWQPEAAGNASVRSLAGLGKLYIAVQGDALFLANDSSLLGELLQRAGVSPPSTGRATYSAVFRLARERDRYEHLMTALDSASPANQTGYGFAASVTRTPSLFSQNLTSLERVFSQVREIRVTEDDDGARVLQNVDYVMRDDKGR
jgi:hypothetical protein